jgi:glycosyltransferase involved in cell wall biosynthesis/O-antigen/teichoic acid export membrane protein
MRSVLIFRSELLAPSETFVLTQAKALRGFAPMFFGLRPRFDSMPHDVPTVWAGGRSRLQCLCVLYRAGLVMPFVLKHIHRFQPSLMHVHFAVDAAEALPLARALKLPMVVTLHGYDVMREDAAQAQTRAGRCYLRRRRQVWSRTAVFLCVSEAVKQRAIKRGFPAHKLRVLAIGTDLVQQVYQSSLTRDPCVLFVGRLVPKKGCDVLLRAFSRLKQRVPDAWLRIVGEGPERTRLEALAAALAVQAEFTGVLPGERVRALMREARCIAAPSRTAADGDAEGLPTVLYEAMAAGVPVASTVHSGIPELITHDESGLLAFEEDIETLAQHLYLLCTDDALAERVRHAARAKVEASFSLTVQTRRLEDVYEEVIAAFGEATKTASQGAKSETSAARLAQSGAGGISTATASTAGGGRLRHQAAWLLSGNSVSIVFQAVYFLLIGRMLGAAQYGAFVGVVALVGTLAQFSSLGMEMVVLRTVACDRHSYAAAFGRGLAITAMGFVILLAGGMLVGKRILPHSLLQLFPYLALSDALFGKVTQICARALQGADHARWSAKVVALTSAMRATAALALWIAVKARGATLALMTWVEVYSIAALVTMAIAFVITTVVLGKPAWARIRRVHLAEGLSFSLSNSSISIYNDIDKTVLVANGMLAAAGAYGAAYRILDIVSTPIVSLFAAASPRLFRDGARCGPMGTAAGARSLLRWTTPYGLVLIPMLILAAPLMPHLFGRSYSISTQALQLLCLLPLLRGLHYAWGTAITACASQWLRTGTQAGSAVLNLLLNLWLIPRFGWHGAAVASLVTDGLLAATTFGVMRVLVWRQDNAAARAAIGQAA